jgi:hypothetical protein
MPLRLSAVAALAALTLSACTTAGPHTVPAADPAAVPALGQAAPASSHGCAVLAGRAAAACTPGARNPQVTQANIATTICKRGWTSTVRPPTSYTTPLKKRQMQAYGLPSPTSLYEEDHLLPLELGGDPRDPRNLWPEPWAGSDGARSKDVEENSLNRAVCGGRLKLADAQAQMLRDWTHR